MLGDDELVSSLLFDAEATRGLVSDWRKDNSDAVLNRSSRKQSVSLTRTHILYCSLLSVPSV